MHIHKQYAAIAFVIALFTYSQVKARELYPGRYRQREAGNKEVVRKSTQQTGGSCCDADGHDFW